MKKYLGIALSITAMATMAFGQQSANPQNPPPANPAGGPTQDQINAILGVNSKGPADSTSQYLVEAHLNNSTGKGFLGLKHRETDGTYTEILSLDNQDCPARGSVNTVKAEHRVRTPEGLNHVFGTADHAIFQGGYDGPMPWGTFFWDVTIPGQAHNPIGVHSGGSADNNFGLDDDSHACIRTTTNCALTITQKAQGPGLSNTTEDRPAAFPNVSGEHPRTIIDGVMDVYVHWI